MRKLGYIFGLIWSLPHTLLGLIFFLPLYWPKRIRWSEGCIEVIPKWILFDPIAQTHGAIIFYRDETYRNIRLVRVHERVHVIQGFILSLLYSVSYVLFFGGKFAAQGFRDWKRAYLWIPWEQQARHVQQEYQDGKRPNAWGSNPEA